MAIRPRKDPTMEEYMNPITEQSEPDGGQETVVASQEAEEATAAAESTGETPESGNGEPERKQQTHADNAAARSARLKAERETRAAMRREQDSEIASMGLVNPYSGETITTMEQLKSYTNQHREASLQERAQKENRPISELRKEEEDKRLAAQKRQEMQESEAKQRTAQEQREFIQADAQDFMAKYPDVNLADLERNDVFRKFCGTRFGREPLADLYESYREIVGGAAAKEKAESRNARSAGGGTGTTGGGLTAAEQGLLEKWNRDHPEMKMTAKEFKER